jgi:hypothetical protein
VFAKSVPILSANDDLEFPAPGFHYRPSSAARAPKNHGYASRRPLVYLMDIYPLSPMLLLAVLCNECHVADRTRVRHHRIR